MPRALLAACVRDAELSAINVYEMKKRKLHRRVLTDPIVLRGCRWRRPLAIS
jgi:hypothetical protein